MKLLTALLAAWMELALSADGQEPPKPSKGEFAIQGAESCTWTIALTDAEEWIKRGQPKDLFRCDGVGIRKVNVSIEGRRVDGTIWLHNETEVDKPLTVVLDLMDGDRVINNAVENTKRFDWKTRGNVLNIKMTNDKEREGYDIYASEQFDPSKINLRITMTPMIRPSAK